MLSVQLSLTILYIILIDPIFLNNNIYFYICPEINHFNELDLNIQFIHDIKIEKLDV